MNQLFFGNNRLLQPHRVLKSSGFLSLHCDPTASHYVMNQCV